MATRNLRQWSGIWDRIPVGGGQYRHELTGEVVTEWVIGVYPGNNDLFVVGKDGQYKTIKVISDSEYTVKVQRTQVRASGGAVGLFDWLDSACTRSQAAYEFNYLQAIWDNTKSIS